MALLALAACTGGTTANIRGSSPGPVAPAPVPDWPTYHFDAARTGSPSGVPFPGELKKAWTARLDGAVYGQPIVVGQMVIAATERNSVYALERTTGKVKWHTRLAPPVPQSELLCGDIDPLGITGTPVFDYDNDRVFVVAETTGFHHVLVGLSIKDGGIQVSRDIVAPDGNPRNDQQRAALTFSDGAIYIAFGGLYGDCGQYVGSVVRLLASGQGPQLQWTVPTARMGGIWGTGGPTIGPDGTIYVSVGNGAATGPPFDGSDSVTGLSPDLQMVSQFAPAHWAEDNAADLDLGSMSPAVMINRILIVGKRGMAYLLHLPALGGVGGQITQAHVCPAYGGPSVSGDTVYLPCGDGGMAAVGTVGDRIKVLWRGPSQADGSPVVGGGMVWVTGGTTLFMLDQGNGTVRDHIEVGKVPHFASPTLSGNFVFVGTLQGVVAISGA